MGGIAAQPSGSGGANKSLSNLANVGINAPLLPDGNGTRDLGSVAAAWANAYIQNIASSIQFDAGATIATIDGINFGRGIAEDIDIFTADEGSADASRPRFWWDNATDSWETNKGLTLPGGSLKIGGYTIGQDADNDGLGKVGAFHARPNGGVSGNFCIHEGTEPAVSPSGNGHRLWANAAHELKWQNELGVSVNLANQNDITTHAALPNAHHTSFVQADADLLYDVLGGLATHAAAADPHTGYQKESEKNAVSGYAGLTASTKLNLAQMQEVISHADLTDAPANAHHVAFVSADADTLIATHAGIAAAHHAKYTDAEAIAAIQGEATLEFQQPTTIGTKSGAGTLTLRSVGNSLILQAGIDIRLKDDVLLFDNKKFQIGTTKDYWFEYNTSGSRLRFWTSNGDGAGTDMTWMRVLDGTINPQFLGAIEVNTINEFTAGVGVTIDGVLLKDSLVNGRNVATDGTKLDGIEAGATADQTGAEIKTAYQVQANAYTDTKNTKLAGIAAGAEVSTKENFYPAGAAVLAGNASFQTDHVTLPDAVTLATCWFTLRIPGDFSSLTSDYPKVVFAQGTGGTGNYRISFMAYATAVGEQIPGATDSIAEFTRAAPGASAEIWEENIAAAFNGLSLTAGDYISLRIDRDSDDAADTFAGDLDVLGVVVKYT